MDDFVRIVFVFQNLIGALASFFKDNGGRIEYFFPSRIIGDFMNDENVLHNKWVVAFYDHSF